MALDRWIALIFIAFCCAYGYLAFFTMDQLLPPFMQRNPVWPSTFPKMLAVGGTVVGLVVLLGVRLASLATGILALLWVGSALINQGFSGLAEMHYALAVVGLAGLAGFFIAPDEVEVADKEPSATDINYRKLFEYNLGQALILIGLMVAYALCLRPIGFLPATIGFVVGGSFVLGERNWLAMILSAVIVAYIVWFLVQITLGIYLLPLPRALPEANDAFIGVNQMVVDTVQSWFEQTEPATEGASQ